MGRNHVGGAQQQEGKGYSEDDKLFRLVVCPMGTILFDGRSVIPSHTAVSGRIKVYNLRY
jgi:hypothetical protein